MGLVKVHAECFSCFIGQAIRSTKLYYNDRDHLLKTTTAVVRILQDIDVEQPPPLISEFVYGTIKDVLHKKDPYSFIKKKFNDIALGYADFMEKEIEGAKDPILYAIRLALAGNIIDFGSQIESFNLQKTIDETVKNPLDVSDIKEFKERLKKANNVVLVADNAGEIVFDKILLKTIKNIYPQKKLYVIVRGGPIINDVTIEDALYVGMNEIAEIVASSKAIPGFWPAYESGRCRQVWDSADIIISKGQGNFETLSELNDERIYFLFLIKCRVVAEYLGLKKLSKIFMKNDRRWEKQPV